MAIIRWNPTPFGSTAFGRGGELNRLRRQMEGLLDSLSGSVATRSGAGVFPALNLGEDQDNLYVTAEIAGVAPSDLDVTVHENNLTIRGERKLDQTDQQANFHRREREGGFFRRVVSLPVKVDPDNVKASVKNGVLKVILAKAAEIKPRQISVQPE